MASETRDPLLKKLREIAIAGLEERRGLVVYTKIEAVEMDRLARQVEQDAIERIRGELPEATLIPEVVNVRERLEQMDAQLAELTGKEGVSETSLNLERDDIVWRAFEEVVYLLGIE